MKRFLCGALFVLLLLLTACTALPARTVPAGDVEVVPTPTPGPTPVPSPTPEPDDGLLHIALIVPKETRGFAAETARSAEARAEARSDALRMTRFDCATVEEMNDALRGAAGRGDDAVLIYPSLGDVQAAAQEAIDSGVAVIALDLAVNAEGAYRIGGDDREIGRAAADALLERLEGEGSAAVLIPEPETDADAARADAFAQALSKAVPKVEVTTYRTGATRAESRITFGEILREGLNMNAIFVPEDELAFGVLAALEDAERDFPGWIVSIGGKQEYLKTIEGSEAETLLTLLYAPSLGEKAVDYVEEIFAGGAVEPVRVLPPVVIEKENAGQYLDAQSRN